MFYPFDFDTDLWRECQLSDPAMALRLPDIFTGYGLQQVDLPGVPAPP
jgi:hypothetical protein